MMTEHVAHFKLPKMALIASHMIHVRSKDCLDISNGYNSHLKVALSTAVARPIGTEFRISLSSAEIPHSWYMISETLLTNQLHVDTSGSQSLIITPGNYDIYELVALIQSTSAFPFSAVFNPNTAKITLKNTDSANHSIHFSHPMSKGLAKLMGFARSDTLLTPDQSITGDSVINLQTIHSLFLYTNLGVTNVVTTEKGNYESILDKIPIHTHPFETIHYNPYQSAPFSCTITDDEIRNFEVSIRDQNGNLVQLNGARYELSILVEVHATRRTNEDPEPNENGTKRRRTSSPNRPEVKIPVTSSEPKDAASPAQQLGSNERMRAMANIREVSTIQPSPIVPDASALEPHGYIDTTEYDPEPDKSAPELVPYDPEPDKSAQEPVPYTPNHPHNDLSSALLMAKMLDLK